MTVQLLDGRVFIVDEIVKFGDKIKGYNQGELQFSTNQEFVWKIEPK